MDKYHVMGAGEYFSDMLQNYGIDTDIEVQEPTTVQVEDFEHYMKHPKAPAHNTLEEAEIACNDLLRDNRESSAFFCIIWKNAKLFATVSHTGTKTFEVI